MTSSPTPGHQPWGQESWNESRPSRVRMVQIWTLSDEWLSRYVKNLHIKLCRSVTGTPTWTWTQTRTTGVTAIALLVLRTGELKRNKTSYSTMALSECCSGKLKMNIARSLFYIGQPLSWQKLLFLNSKNRVTKLLKGLNPSKALGLDELHLRELATELGPVFARLFQQSIITGEIPKEWSLAKTCIGLQEGWQVT